jgi:hypothetical protein
MSRWAATPARRNQGSALLSAGRAAREWKEDRSATQRGPAVGGEIDGHDSRGQRDGRRGGGGGGARDVRAAASCRLLVFWSCLFCKWAGLAK